MANLQVLSRDEVACCPRWQHAFANEHNDHRYYELLEDTLPEGLIYRYFAIEGESGDVRAIQPFFLISQDLLAGTGSTVGALVDGIRVHWPGLLKPRMLMIGCAAGEGHLDGEPSLHGANAKILAANVLEHARRLKAQLVVMKEFPAKYRNALNCFIDYGFRRVPSLPMTRLSIAYANFDEYMNKALNSATDQITTEVSRRRSVSSN